MKSPLPSCLLPILIALTLVLPYPTHGEDLKEPPLRFNIDLDGNSFVLDEGSSATLPELPQDTQISVRIDPYRMFQLGGISFLYPNHFKFEAAPAFDSLLTLTLSDGKYSIRIREGKDLGLGAETEVAKLKALYEASGVNCISEKISLRLNGINLDGIQLISKIELENCTYEEYTLVIELPARDGVAIISLIDSGMAGDLPTKTAIEMMEILNTSLKLD